jgi:phosphoserine phosphatase
MKLTLALIDWDGTIRKGFTIRDFCIFIAKQLDGPFCIVEHINKLFDKYHTGAISHDNLAKETALVYAKYIQGRTEIEISQIISEFLPCDKKSIFGFSQELFELLKSEGIKPIVISGCLTEIISEYKEEFGLSDILGLVPQIENGVYTGNIIENPGISSIKEKLTNSISHKGNLSAISFGNSDSDLPLFHSSAINVVVNNHDLIVPGLKLSISETPDAIRLINNIIKKEF